MGWWSPFASSNTGLRFEAWVETYRLRSETTEYGRVASSSLCDCTRYDKRRFQNVVAHFNARFATKLISYDGSDDLQPEPFRD